MPVAKFICALLFARGTRPTRVRLAPARQARASVQLYSIRVNAVVLGAAADLDEVWVSA